MEAKVDKNLKVEVHIPHAKQKYRWDCGLACVEMVLGYLDCNFDNFNEVCKKLGFGQSVWTIDIANILALYGVQHSYCTVTLGVDSGYSNKSFYRSHFQSDEQRVNDVFTNASENGISLQKRSVDLEEILVNLCKESVIIVLADWSKLNCKWCMRKCLSPSLGCISSCPTAYQGHFIVVVGYCHKDKVIYYHNPSFDTELCCCSMKTFEAARRSYGTDEDIVFVHK